MARRHQESRARGASARRRLYHYRHHDYGPGGRSLPAAASTSRAGSRHHRPPRRRRRPAAGGGGSSGSSGAGRGTTPHTGERGGPRSSSSHSSGSRTRSSGTCRPRRSAPRSRCSPTWSRGWRANSSGASPRPSPGWTLTSGRGATGTCWRGICRGCRYIGVFSWLGFVLCIYVYMCVVVIDLSNDASISIHQQAKFDRIVLEKLQISGGGQMEITGLNIRVSTAHIYTEGGEKKLRERHPRQVDHTALADLSIHLFDDNRYHTGAGPPPGAAAQHDPPAL